MSEVGPPSLKLRRVKEVGKRCFQVFFQAFSIWLCNLGFETRICKLAQFKSANMAVKKTPLSRRAFLKAAALAVPVPALFRSPGMRPQIPSGVGSGDALADRAVLWSRSDRPARMWIDWSTSEGFENAHTVRGPAALPQSDYTVKLDLAGLPPGREIFYRVRFQSLEDLKLWSEPAAGHFRTAPVAARDIRFLWSGDTAGQGWGIDPAFGGMRIYQTMLRRQPDFFIHSGDTIYADGPLQAEAPLPGGGVWRNIVTEAKSKVAETIQEFRGNYAYNLMDEHVRAFNAQVPVLYQWDDHEVINNWYPQQLLDDARYTEKSAALLAARANRAFLEYNPVRSSGEDPERIFRTIHYGPLLDVFVIDMRSYRGPNGPNRQPAAGPDTELLGSLQVEWLQQALKNSTATWKVIASDMPIGLIVYDDYIGKSTFENAANGPGPALGRELEIAGILRFILHNDIRNVVWLTADVHYTAAHYYDPAKAQFKDFRPFYEFISGPLHAGTFGPNELDDTFGPQVLFQKAPPPGQFNLPPSAGLQFFGEVNIDAASKTMTVTLRDLAGDALYELPLQAES
jgi:alkaline phosphatase D